MDNFRKRRSQIEKRKMQIEERMSANEKRLERSEQEMREVQENSSVPQVLFGWPKQVAFYFSLSWVCIVKWRYVCASNLLWVYRGRKLHLITLTIMDYLDIQTQPMILTSELLFWYEPWHITLTSDLSRQAEKTFLCLTLTYGLTFNSIQAKVKVKCHAKNQGRRSNDLASAATNRQTNTHTQDR